MLTDDNGCKPIVIGHLSLRWPKKLKWAYKKQISYLCFERMCIHLHQNQCFLHFGYQWSLLKKNKNFWPPSLSLNNWPIGHIAHMKNIFKCCLYNFNTSLLSLLGGGCGLLNKLESLSSNDALYQVWLTLTQWFWMRLNIFNIILHFPVIYSIITVCASQCLRSYN